MDFDPRDSDSRDDERYESNQSRGSLGSSDDRDRDDEWSQPHNRSRERDDDARTLGRGPGSDSRASHADEHSRDSDARWPERYRDHRQRDVDPRDVFIRYLRLPRGMDREIVRDRDRQYTLRGSESRTLATVGAFRVVSSRDLLDHHDRPADPVWRPAASPRARAGPDRSRRRLSRPRSRADERRPEPAGAPP